MAAKKEELLTAGKIAQNLSVPPAAVKKAIEKLKLAPTAKKGACSYYSSDALNKIKGALK
ncbi:MAG: hypothetical protein C0412_05170 [Flavobacterium sp.]|nr:hypothetical protein [Flavobacterium sp.]